MKLPSTMGQMIINIIVDNDKCWLLNTLEKLIPFFRKNKIYINHIWILPDKLGSLKGIKINLWYLKVFGLFIFFKLVFFYIFVLILNYRKNLSSFGSLARENNIDYTYINNLKDKLILKKNIKGKKNFYFIFTNHIIPKKLLKNKNNIFINKHSSLLPSFKGLFPFIWSKIYNGKNGISVHLVEKKIDSGKVIFQKEINYNFTSMVDFYMYVYKRVPEYLLKSFKKFKNKKFLKLSNKDSYYSLPKRSDIKKFLDCGGKVINLKDFFSILKFVK